MYHMTEPHPSAAAFRAARDLLLRHRDDYETARREFSWPALDEFNWALDWFDVIAAEHPDRLALRIVANGDAAAQLSYGELAARSSQVANWLSDLGARRGDRLLLMLGNIAPLWEVILAAMKLGVVIIPASTLLGTADLADRIARGDVRHVVTAASHCPKFDGLGGRWTAIAVGAGPGGGTPDGWLPYADSADSPETFAVDGVTRATDPLLLYFTSGTTAQPKLVEHTHASYPAGHLSTMYWIGLQPGDVHLNISSPGWAKHAWSNVFAPWNAAATALILGHERFSPQALLDAIGACGVTTFCAPPTVWRLLIQSDLTSADTATLRESVAAGEPLNPEVIEQVRRAWDITVRDGYGQTETTAQIGNSPGQPVKPGTMGRPLPGYAVVLVDPITGDPAPEGEICLDLSDRPMGLMTGYRGDPERDAEAMRGGYYHTGDVAARDEDGYLTYIGRTDDVFKASGYRISPFELESVLIEHEAVAEAAVVPSPDPMRFAVPKAYVMLVAGAEVSPETALSILAHARERLAPYKRVRRLEFGELPKTISGKIRRVELRDAETERLGPAGSGAGARGVTEFWEDDFPDLKAVSPDKSP
jgi:acetyl-CoA synthetase